MAEFFAADTVNQGPGQAARFHGLGGEGAQPPPLITHVFKTHQVWVFASAGDGD